MSGCFRVRMISSYKDLLVWQRAMELVLYIYPLTRRFPREEQYGLSIQVRRAASSVAANIAEGQGRCTRGEFLQFLGNAQGSLRETETHLILAQRLGYISSPEYRAAEERIAECGRLLSGLSKALRRKPPRDYTPAKH